MTDKPPGEIVPRGGGGFFQDIANRIKLIVRLMGDRRVNPLLKLLPIGSLVYLLVPDLVLGPFDDAAVIWLGAYLFVELCPQEVVQEHMEALTSVIEGTFRELSDDD
jgi:hypothetical protein